MSKEFFDAVKAIEAEKGIPAEYLYEKISAAIIVAAKHDYNGKDIVHCDIDPGKAEIKVYVSNDDATAFVSDSVKIDELTPENIVNILVQKSVLSSDVQDFKM